MRFNVGGFIRKYKKDTQKSWDEVAKDLGLKTGANAQEASTRTHASTRKIENIAQNMGEDLETVVKQMMEDD